MGQTLYCLPARLTHYAEILKDKQASPHRRLEALLWVVHLVGR